jgi:hypothetical protein
VIAKVAQNYSYNEVRNNRENGIGQVPWILFLNDNSGAQGCPFKEILLFDDVSCNKQNEDFNRSYNKDIV